MSYQENSTCSRCGHAIPSQARFCSNCAQPVSASSRPDVSTVLGSEEPAAPYDASTNPYYESPYIPPPPPKRPPWTLIMLVLAVLVLAGGVIGAIAFVNHNNQVVANATATAQIARNATATVVIAKATFTAQTNAAATATANANSDPYTHRGTLAINDPLSQLSQSHFINFTKSGGSCEFTNGNYQQQATQQNENFVCLAQGVVDFSHFTFEVRIEILDGNCGGMTFRSPNGMVSDTYAYVVCSDGGYFVAAYQGGVEHTLKIGSSSAILTGLQAINTLAIVADGNTFNLFVNKQQIATISDPNSTFSHGDIGLLAEDVNTPTKVVFSKLRVWTL